MDQSVSHWKLKRMYLASVGPAVVFIGAKDHVLLCFAGVGAGGRAGADGGCDAR